MVVLQVLFYRQRGRQRPHAQKIVPTAVAGAPFHHRLLAERSGRLAQAGQRVKLSQEADHRPPLSEAAGKSGGDARQIAPDLKAPRGQGVTKQLCGKLFPETDFRVLPNLVAQIPQQFTILFNGKQRISLLTFHRFSFLSANFIPS